jgi:hypothetical protein
MHDSKATEREKAQAATMLALSRSLDLVGRPFMSFYVDLGTEWTWKILAMAHADYCCFASSSTL